LLGVAHSEVEATVALNHLRNGRTADRRLDDSVDVAREYAVAGRARTVDLDDERGLSTYLEDTHIGSSGNGLQSLLESCLPVM